MPNIGDAAFSQGDVMRRLRELEAQVRELTAGRRLENASVGQGGIRIHGGGGLRVHEGGGITIEDGGDLEISGGGDFNLSGSGDITLDGGGSLTLDGGDVNVNDGGDVNVNDGGNIRVRDGGVISVEENSLRILNSDGTFLAAVEPVEFTYIHDQNDGISFDTSEGIKATASAPIPSWADEALVMGSFAATGLNNQAGGAYLTIWGEVVTEDVHIFPGGSFFATASGIYATGFTSGVILVTDLNTANMTIRTRARTSAGDWGSDPLNYGGASAAVVFRRAS